MSNRSHLYTIATLDLRGKLLTYARAVTYRDSPGIQIVGGSWISLILILLALTSRVQKYLGYQV